MVAVNADKQIGKGSSASVSMRHWKFGIGNPKNAIDLLFLFFVYEKQVWAFYRISVFLFHSVS